ncbi:MAG TPA: peptidyl-prolyl cis-trans isomerase [Armatimonadota bacterium]|nr:peptidyl-prolyl cis-trans isomerase [Armatimonadota bacterium]
MDSVQKRVLLVIAAAFVCSAIIAGCGRGTVAKVDGRRIGREEYYSRLQRLPFTDPNTRQQTEAGAWVLDGMINEVLLVRLAEKEGVPPTGEQVRQRTEEAKKEPAFRTWVRGKGITEDELRELMRVEQAVFNMQTKGVKVTDKEVSDYYGRNKLVRFTTPEQAEVRVIFAKNKADADKAMSMLKRGMTFETVVSTMSVEPNSARQGGYIPAIGRHDDRIPQPVREMIFGLKPNRYTEPIPYTEVEGQRQYLIFKLVQRRKERTQKLAEVKYAVQQQLMLEKGSQKGAVDIERKMAEFRKKVDIHVGIVRYKNVLVPPTPEAKGKKEVEGKTEAPKR